MILQYIKFKKQLQKDKNTYNIKEYEVINDNIMIHNKFKKELIDNINNKVIINNLIKNERNLKEHELLKNMNIESINYNIELLKSKIKNTKIDINNLKNLLKLDINNLLNDIKYNNLTQNDKSTLKQNIKKELVKNNNDIIHYNKLHNNIFIENKIYNKLLQNVLQLLKIKDKLLIKKYKIYIKLLN